MPTRVIAVGRSGDKTVHLHETKPEDHGEWIALSHQWGTGKMFCTTTANRDKHVKGIRVDSLPLTFKHAVEMTRALGHQFLWIDSLCIIQGPGGDFNQQAKRMEQVYSGAYCILASSRSPGHGAGFLNDRTTRQTVALQGQGQQAPFFISDAIDNFDLHVLNGSLNKRGWVLQEHALARRTVYFTDTQTYFQCGNGVRCETMSKMTNDLATLLGDPNFPNIIMKADRGERILRYQDLYATYSRLALSRDHDRPMAIDGLQERILKAINADGGYGIFDEGNRSGRRGGLLRRSLLWHRAAETKGLTRIVFPMDHPMAKTPTWSWMGYSGGIEYLSMPFGGMKWEKMSSPWSSNLDEEPYADIESGNLALVAKVQDYNTESLRDGQGDIMLDCPDISQKLAKRCVVLGKQRSDVSLGKQKLDLLLQDKNKVHYLRVVTPTHERDHRGRQVYERVGVAYLPGKCIRAEGEMIAIR